MFEHLLIPPQHRHLLHGVPADSIARNENGDESVRVVQEERDYAESAGNARRSSGIVSAPTALTYVQMCGAVDNTGQVAINPQTTSLGDFRHTQKSFRTDQIIDTVHVPGYPQNNGFQIVLAIGTINFQYVNLTGIWYPSNAIAMVPFGTNQRVSLPPRHWQLSVAVWSPVAGIATVVPVPILCSNLGDGR